MAKLIPLQKIILWRKNGPRSGQFSAAWISSDKRTPPIYQLPNGQFKVRISEFYRGAVEGGGNLVDLGDVQPYNDAIWRAIERVRDHEGKIVEAKRKLRRGELPDVVLQGELFE